MKIITILFTALIALNFTPLARSADGEAKRERRPDGAGGRFGGGLEGLDLNDEQKSKIREFMEENGEKLRGLRDDQNTPREEKMKKFQEFQQAMTAKMKEVLNTDQFEKWQKQRLAAPGGLGAGRDQMRKVLEGLNLTPDQQEKVRAAMQEQGEEMQKLRDATPEERREKFQKMQETMSAKMKDILDKEQFEKWEKARSEMATRFGGGGDGPRKKPDNK